MISNLLSNSMKHGALDRFNPVSARRLYKSIWEIFRIDTHNSHRRRLLKARPVLDTGGIRLIPETTQTGAQGASWVQK